MSPLLLRGLSSVARVGLPAIGIFVAVTPLTTGVLAASRQPINLGQTSVCSVTKSVGERPPDDPHMLPFAKTSGPWYVNADRTMWAWVGGITPGTLRIRLLWVRPAATAVTIAARRLDGDAGPVATTIPSTSPWTYQTTDLEFPVPGCWEVTGTAAGHVLRFTMSVLDPSARPSPRAPAALGTGTGIGVGVGSGLPLDPKSRTVTTPRLVHEVKPVYTPEARKAGIAGSVSLDAVVMPDGTVGAVIVTRSLDTQYGLDDEAVKTVKQWRFEPGTRNGVPVPVMVAIELSFRLK
jgi:TonB family protein